MQKKMQPICLYLLTQDGTLYPSLLQTLSHFAPSLLQTLSHFAPSLLQIEYI